MMQISDNMRGAGLMVGSMVAFTINDAFMKGLAGEIPLFQALFVRGVATVICLVILAYFLRQLDFKQSKRDWGMILLRAIAEVGGAYFFITALFNMPIANASAILQALPLTVALGGAIFLRETLGWRRVLAIITGFVGVMLIVRPGSEGFTIYSIYALLAVACVTMRDLVVRRMSRHVPSVFVALVAAFFVMLSGAVVTATQVWVPVDSNAGLLLLGSAAFVVFGYVFSVAAMRTGELGFVAPFRYASLITALILGWAVFGDWPRNITLLGAFIVVATGMFTLYREQVAAKRLRKTSQSVPH
tara:strand:- start:1004 stop:1909 length:906 start_codon:yes stop_codon:yes gene_type:complete